MILNNLAKSWFFTAQMCFQRVPTCFHRFRVLSMTFPGQLLEVAGPQPQRISGLWPSGRGRQPWGVCLRGNDDISGTCDWKSSCPSFLSKEKVPVQFLWEWISGADCVVTLLNRTKVVGNEVGARVMWALTFITSPCLVGPCFTRVSPQRGCGCMKRFTMLTNVVCSKIHLNF